MGPLPLAPSRRVWDGVESPAWLQKINTAWDHITFCTNFLLLAGRDNMCTIGKPLGRAFSPPPGHAQIPGSSFQEAVGEDAMELRTRPFTPMGWRRSRCGGAHQLVDPGKPAIGSMNGPSMAGSGILQVHSGPLR